MDLIQYSADYLIRNIRNHDRVVIFTVFVFKIMMLLVIQTLWFVDVFILNLLYSIDLFFTLRDWRKCSKNLFFGSLYLLTTRGGNIGVVLFCGSAVVTVWIATYRRDGSPCITWIFFPCLLIYVLQMLFQQAAEVVVSFEVLRTAYMFIFSNERKIFEDILVVFAFTSLHLVFAEEDYNIHFIAISYGLSIAWMYFKS